MIITEPMLPVFGPVRGSPDTGEGLARMLVEDADAVFALTRQDVANLAVAVVDLQRRLREATVCAVPQPTPEVEYEE